MLISENVTSIEEAENLIKTLKKYISNRKIETHKQIIQKPKKCKECPLFAVIRDFDGDVKECYCNRPDKDETEHEDLILSDDFMYVYDGSPPEWCFLNETNK